MFRFTSSGKIIGVASADVNVVDVNGRIYGKLSGEIVVVLHLRPGVLDHSLRLVVASRGRQDMLQNTQRFQRKIAPNAQPVIDLKCLAQWRLSLVESPL